MRATTELEQRIKEKLRYLAHLATDLERRAPKLKFEHRREAARAKAKAYRVAIALLSKP